jgi:hypothetical protein
MIFFIFRKREITPNVLRASEGRETKALNCKPITNLKEKSELSNYCKPAVFVCTLLLVVAHTLNIKTHVTIASHASECRKAGLMKSKYRNSVLGILFSIFNSRSDNLLYN